MLGVRSGFGESLLACQDPVHHHSPDALGAFGFDGFFGLSEAHGSRILPCLLRLSTARGVLRLGRAIGFNQTRRIAAKAWRVRPAEAGMARSGLDHTLADRPADEIDPRADVELAHGVGEVALDRFG